MRVWLVAIMMAVAVMMAGCQSLGGCAHKKHFKCAKCIAVDRAEHEAKKAMKCKKCGATKGLCKCQPAEKCTKCGDGPCKCAK